MILSRPITFERTNIRLNYFYIGRTSRAISDYIRAYKRDGLEGLDISHSPGRSRKLTPDSEKEVCLVLTEKRPEDVGFPAEMNWTSPLLCK